MSLRYLAPATPGWQTEAFTCSALTREGIPEFWKLVLRFDEEMKASGQFIHRRQQQRVEWMFAMAEQHLKDRFYHNDAVRKAINPVKQAVAEGTMSTSVAAERLLNAFYDNFQPHQDSMPR